MDIVRKSIANILYFENITRKAPLRKQIVPSIPVVIEENDPNLINVSNDIPFEHRSTIEFFKSLSMYINPWQKST